MAVTADELVDIAKKHGIDNWRTYDRMRTITNSEPAGTLLTGRTKTAVETWRVHDAWVTAWRIEDAQ